jgi:phage terminase small subunit
LKVLRGTDRKDRRPRKPAEPRKGRARPPAWLPIGERRAFESLARQMEACGTPPASFVHVLTPTAIIWEQLRQDTEALATEAGSTYESTTTKGARKLVLRPEVSNRAATLKLLRSYLETLGLTPSSVGRIDLSAMPRQRTDAEEARVERFFGDPDERFMFGAR